MKHINEQSYAAAKAMVESWPEWKKDYQITKYSQNSTGDRHKPQDKTTKSCHTASGRSVLAKEKS